MAAWDHARCPPYFKRLETSAIGLSEALRGYVGSQPLERGPVTTPRFLTSFAAEQQAGYP